MKPLLDRQRRVVDASLWSSAENLQCHHNRSGTCKIYMSSTVTNIKKAKKNASSICVFLTPTLNLLQRGFPTHRGTSRAFTSFIIRWIYQRV